MEITKEALKIARTLIGNHEGVRNKPYTDTVGKLTIGIGRNITDVGLSNPEIEYLFQNDVDYFYNKFLDTFTWFKDLSLPRQVALIDMSFMGWKKFLEFQKMIGALEKGNFGKAADEILASKYATQVGKRAQDLAKIIKTGSL